MRFNLGILSTRLAADLADLALLADQASGTTGRERNAIGEYCLVQIQDSWSRFVRDLVLRSSLGNASRADGTKIPPGVHGRLFERDARLFISLERPQGNAQSHPPHARIWRQLKGDLIVRNGFFVAVQTLQQRCHKSLVIRLPFCIGQSLLQDKQRRPGCVTVNLYTRQQHGKKRYS